MEIFVAEKLELDGRVIFREVRRTLEQAKWLLCQEAGETLTFRPFFNDPDHITAFPEKAEWSCISHDITRLEMPD